MSTPIDRDRQIHLMVGAKQRMADKAAQLLSVPVIADALRRPAPGQRENGYVQTTVVRDRRCG